MRSVACELIAVMSSQRFWTGMPWHLVQIAASADVAVPRLDNHRPSRSSSSIVSSVIASRRVTPVHSYRGSPFGPTGLSHVVELISSARLGSTFV